MRARFAHFDELYMRGWFGGSGTHILTAYDLLGEDVEDVDSPIEQPERIYKNEQEKNPIEQLETTSSVHTTSEDATHDSKHVSPL